MRHSGDRERNFHHAPRAIGRTQVIGNQATALAARRVVVIGATSPLGMGISNAALLSGSEVLAVSRSLAARPKVKGAWSSVRLNLRSSHACSELRLAPTDLLISAAPLREFARAITATDLPRGLSITAISSASATTKAHSRFPRDARWSQEMRNAELAIAAATSGNARILRPTMIYGSGRDRNVAHIARMLASLHLLPLIGGGVGLRAPVHVDDLARVVLAAACSAPTPKPIHVPGAECLTFREMVRRIAAAAKIRYAEIPLPSFPFSLGGRMFANVGRIGWTFAACARMAEDLTVPDDASVFGVARRGFHPDARAVGLTEHPE